MTIKLLQIVLASAPEEYVVLRYRAAQLKARLTAIINEYDVVRESSPNCSQASASRRQVKRARQRSNKSTSELQSYIRRTGFAENLLVSAIQPDFTGVPKRDRLYAEDEPNRTMSIETWFKKKKKVDHQPEPGSRHRKVHFLEPRLSYINQFTQSVLGLSKYILLKAESSIFNKKCQHRKCRRFRKCQVRTETVTQRRYRGVEFFQRAKARSSMVMAVFLIMVWNLSMLLLCGGFGKTLSTTQSL